MATNGQRENELDDDSALRQSNSTAAENAGGDRQANTSPSASSAEPVVTCNSNFLQQQHAFSDGSSLFDK